MQSSFDQSFAQVEAAERGGLDVIWIAELLLPLGAIGRLCSSPNRKRHRH
jgi:alkanesulfonate monooxygenase SsuD/methylene tetrahydromethanopterin reductase-like flavin-dependent oxidoreductase (luciferase family)